MLFAWLTFDSDIKSECCCFPTFKDLCRYRHPFFYWECKGKDSYVSHQKFLLYFFAALAWISICFVKNWPRILVAGGKNTMTDSTSQFLLPFLSTIHPAFIHILRAIFTETGGKDRGTIVAAKCFLKARILKTARLLYWYIFQQKKLFEIVAGIINTN